MSNSFSRRLVLAGARFVGGCCGTDPDHIRMKMSMSMPKAMAWAMAMMCRVPARRVQSRSRGG